MKLGTQTNSLVNHILSRAIRGEPAPTVGMGATILMWTDRQPATIVAVETYRGQPMVTVQEDRARRVDSNGLSECQEYEYSPDNLGAKWRFAKSKAGDWREMLEGRMARSGRGLRIGERRKYHDFSF